MIIYDKKSPQKFRVYDRKRKIMLVNHTFKTITLCGLGSIEHLKWMDYLGLLDSNNREIYESDIVRMNDAEYGIVVKILTLNSFKYCIELSDGSLVDFTNCDKVIGNIYENPDLVNL